MLLKRLRRIVSAFLAALALLGTALAEDDISWWLEENWGWVIRDDTLIVEEGVYCVGICPDEYVIEVGGSSVPRVVPLADDYRHGVMEEPYTTETFTKLQLPSSLRILGCEALYFMPFEEVVLPEGLIFIDIWAMEGCKAERVYIPSTVERIEPGAFAAMNELQQIEVSPKNPYFTSVDGVLYTKDMTALIAYPVGREAEHFDVPAGVRRIEAFAFYEGWDLQSISLPFGLEFIGRRAFSSCIELRYAALPMTLRQIEAYAFENCIVLENTTLPPSAELICSEKEKEWITSNNLGEWSPERAVFYNAGQYKLRSQSQYSPEKHGQDYQTPEEYFLDDAYDYILEIHGVIDPVNADDRVDVFEDPDEESPVLVQFGCGTSVEITGYLPDWYQISYPVVNDFGETKDREGYVRETQLRVFIKPESLFVVKSARPAHDRLEYWTELPQLPLEGEGTPLPEGAEMMDLCSLEPPWAYCWFRSSSFRTGAYINPADLLFTRYDDGTDRVYGLVISDELQNRLHLREKPDKASRSLGRYFSGTQVEIFEEKGDWYRVRVGTQEGWMMKKFIRIVPAEKE
ncbi:MAG: hypothetical protein E7331_03385 [Clostridiales bacterium]|nr:hypothetical protein [Clostridiales bacterium]